MLGDISKAIGKEFLIAVFVPSSVLVGANVLFVRWKLLPAGWVQDWNVFGVPRAGAILIVIFGAALVLSLASSVLYRVFEGYHPKGLLYGGVGASGAGVLLFAAGAAPRLSAVVVTVGVTMALAGLGQRVALAYHRARAARWRASLSSPKPQPLEQYRFVRRYPQDPGLILPTAFGNILRAFEEYPARLWVIDPITIWPRLAAILPDGVATQIGDAKITVSLLLNLCVVALWLAIETVFVAPITVGDRWFWATIAWLAVAGGAYRAASSAASRWGETVRSAFDLYRLDLLTRMKVELPKGPFTFADERTIWAGVQVATFYAKDPGDALHLVVSPKAPGNARDPWGS